MIKPLAATVSGPVDAPVVALGNSLGTTRSMWGPQLAALQGRCRVLQWDLPGHGAAPASMERTIDNIAQSFIGVLDAHGIDRVRYCGISIGGMIGLWLAAQIPARVERLVVCCASAHLGEPAYWRQRADRVRAAGMASITGPVTERWFTPGYGRRTEMLAAMRTEFESTDPDAYARCCEALAVMDLRALLAAVRCPTLVVAGADDAAIPPAHARLIARGVAGATYVVVDHAAHLATIEGAPTVTPLLVHHLLDDTGGSDDSRKA